MEVWNERALQYPNLDEWQALLPPAPNPTSLETLLAAVDAAIDVEAQYNPVPLPDGSSRVFRAFEVIAPGDVRFVIVGQDPYADAALATGVAFATPNDAALSPSLAQIFAKLLQADPTFQQPTHDLEDWIANEVLLLNASLTWTNPENKVAKRAWRGLVAALLAALAAHAVEHQQVLHLVLLGRDAQRAAPPAHAEFVQVRRFSHPTARWNARNHFRDSEVFHRLPAFWARRR